MRPRMLLCFVVLLAACGSQQVTAQQDCEDRGGVYHQERQECFGAEEAEPSASTAEPTARPTPRPTPRATPRPTPKPTPRATPRPTPVPTPAPTPVPQTWEDRLAAAENVAYDELFRNSDSYLFTDVYFRGEIIQVLGEPGGWNFRINVTPDQYGFWSDTVLVESYGEQRYLEDDVVDFVGTFTGPYTYETIFGGEVTIPGILILDDIGMRLVE